MLFLVTRRLYSRIRRQQGWLWRNTEVQGNERGAAAAGTFLLEIANS
jgi:hypothetical protein